MTGGSVTKTRPAYYCVALVKKRIINILTYDDAERLLQSTG